VKRAVRKSHVYFLALVCVYAFGERPFKKVAYSNGCEREGVGMLTVMAALKYKRGEMGNTVTNGNGKE
jgi:hypothetical protein